MLWFWVCVTLFCHSKWDVLCVRQLPVGFPGSACWRESRLAQAAAGVCSVCCQRQVFAQL